MFLCFLYVLNAVLLILHEIESAYEKEWEILGLPGKISFFLILHIPVLFLLFYGLIGLTNGTIFGKAAAILSGIGGLIPFAVHKLLVNKKSAFNKTISNIIIYGNCITGLLILVLLFFSK